MIESALLPCRSCPPDKHHPTGLHWTVHVFTRAVQKEGHTELLYSCPVGHERVWGIR